MAQQYQKVELRRLPKAPSTDSSEASFWKKFRYPILLQQHAAVTCIDFSPVAPHDFVVTSSARAQIFNAKTNEVKKDFSRFKDVAYSTRFRSDGQLIVGGCDDGLVRVFDADSRSLLRVFTADNKRPARLTRFSTNNRQILAGYDDGAVACWDLSSNTPIFTLSAHKDHVRSGLVSPASEHIWITGSHDHAVKVWDTRSKECIATMEHQAPIEDIISLPGGGIIITAAGNELRIFDALSGFRLLDTLSAHQKPLTSLAYDPARSRLFTASLDSTVKAFDTSSYKIVHVHKFPAPVLSVGISPNSTHLVAGMSDGMLSIRHRVVKVVETVDANTRSFAVAAPESSAPRGLPAMSREYMLRGSDYNGANEEVKLAKLKKQKLRKYDQLLRKFQYKKALDAAIETREAIVVFSLFEEFIRRGELTVPLSGRNELTLQPIIHFLFFHFRNPHFMSTIILVANRIFDLYGPTIGLSPTLDSLYLKLQVRVRDEIAFQKSLTSLVGLLDTVFAANLKSTAAPLASTLDSQAPTPATLSNTNSSLPSAATPSSSS